MSGSGEYTTTPNLGLFKPTYNADAENWGFHLNSNSDILDGALAGGGPFLPLTGGTVTGPLTLGSGTGAPVLTINGAVGAVKGIAIQTSGTNRWLLETTAADNLALNAYDAAGTWYGTAIQFANDASTIVMNFPLVPNTTAAIAQGGVVGINATARNTGTNAGQGAKFTYFSTGSANGFHIGKSSLAIHDPTSFVGSAPVYQSDWMVCVSPNDTAHNWGATTMEMNVTNRGNDMGWKRDRGSANPTGVLLLVPETNTFGGTGGGEGKNATFGLSMSHSGATNSTGTFAKFYNGLLIEPDTIVGLTGRGIYMTGDITATPSQYPYGPMQFEGAWLHGIDHTKATYDDGRATTMAMGQRITWIAGATGAETSAASILATGSGADASLALNAGGSGGVTVNSLLPLTVNIVAQSGVANALLLQESAMVTGGATVVRMGKDFSTTFGHGFMYYMMNSPIDQSTFRLGVYGTPLEHLTLRGDGALTIGATSLGFFNIAPIAKRTGYGAPTGTATRTTFLTSSVTLPVLAEHVKALIDDLTAYGLLGT